MIKQVFLLAFCPVIAAAQVFDVASIRQTDPTANSRSTSNVPLGPGNVYSPIHGRFTAAAHPLIDYIAFAYKLPDTQLTALQSQAPAWVRDDRFDIQANTDQPGLTKDDLRQMMRALLAERFHLALHFETRTLSVLALVLLKPGTPGPNLRPHSAAEACSTTLPPAATPDTPPPPEATPDGFPTTCGGIVLLPPHPPYRFSIGGRNVPLDLIATSSTSWGGLDRPVVDATGLTGQYDFLLEFTPHPLDDSGVADPEGPAFEQALHKQLGLKLEPRKSDLQVLQLDHIDHLTQN